MCSSDVNCFSALTLRPVARLPSGGCVSEREDRAAKGVGCGRGCPPPTGEGFEEGVVPPSPENF